MSRPNWQRTHRAVLAAGSAVICTAISSVLSAQSTMPATRSLGPAWCNAALTGQELVARTSVGSNITTRSTVQNAARAFYQRPDSGPAFGAVMTAARVDVCRGSKVSIGPFVEYQWTSMPGARTNTLAAGLSGDWQLRTMGMRKAHSTPVLDFNLLHRSDREQQRDAVQFIAQSTFVMTSRRWPAPNTIWDIGTLARFTWAPVVGTAVDRAITGPAERRGTTVRLLTSAQAQLRPISDKIPLRLSAAFGRQVDLREAVDDDLDVHDLLRVNLDIDLVDTDNVTAGATISREQGRDPLRAIPERRFWFVGLSFSKPRRP